MRRYFLSLSLGRLLGSARQLALLTHLGERISRTGYPKNYSTTWWRGFQRKGHKKDDSPTWGRGFQEQVIISKPINQSSRG